MRAHKLSITIPDTRRLELVLPDEVLPGEAEIIVLMREGSDAPPGTRPSSQEAVTDAVRAADAWRAQRPGHSLSKEDIDRHLTGERPDRATRPLAAALAEIGHICEDEGYTLELPDRVDRPAPPLP